MKKTRIKNFIFRITGLEWLIWKIKLIYHNRKNYRNFLKHKREEWENENYVCYIKIQGWPLKDDKIDSKEGE